MMQFLRKKIVWLVAILFLCSSSYVSASTSVEIWIKFSSFPADSENLMYWRDNGAGPYVYNTINHLTTGVFGMYDSTVEFSADDSQTANSTSHWYHVVITADGTGGLSQTVDGIESSTVTGSAITDFTGFDAELATCTGHNWQCSLTDPGGGEEGGASSGGTWGLPTTTPSQLHYTNSILLVLATIGLLDILRRIFTAKHDNK